VITLTSSYFTFNGCFTMSWEDLPQALYSHINKVNSMGLPRNTVQLEGDKPTSPKEWYAFGYDICLWGGKTGRAFIIPKFKKNSAKKIKLAFLGAKHSLHPIAALKSITTLHGLGVSYGSKMLRMMYPQKWVTYDKVIHNKLEYPGSAPSINKYYEVCVDFQEISKEASKQKLINPIHAEYGRLKLSDPRGNGKNWWPADIECAVFAVSQGWYIPKGKIKRNSIKKERKNMPTKPKKNPSAIPSSTKSPGRLHSGEKKFDDFWEWLQTIRVAQTLDKRSKIKGLSNQTHLHLTTSGGTSVSPIQKATVNEYCSQVLWNRQKKLSGNKRYVAALLLEYLSL